MLLEHLRHQALVDLLDLKETEETWDHQDPLVCQEGGESKDQGASPVQKETLDRRDPQALLEDQELTDSMD